MIGTQCHVDNSASPLLKANLAERRHRATRKKSAAPKVPLRSAAWRRSNSHAGAERIRQQQHRSIRRLVETPGETAVLALAKARLLSRITTASGPSPARRPGSRSVHASWMKARIMAALLSCNMPKRRLSRMSLGNGTSGSDRLQSYGPISDPRSAFHDCPLEADGLRPATNGQLSLECSIFDFAAILIIGAHFIAPFITGFV